MPIKTIDVKFVNQPKPGKKEGSLKLADDSFMGVSPALLPQFKPGGTYEVEFSSREWQGRQFHSVVDLKKTVGEAPASVPAHSKPDTRRDEHIFICGAFNNALANGQVQASDLEACIKLIATLREVYARTLGHKLSKEMDDSIPY